MINMKHLSLLFIGFVLFAIGPLYGQLNSNNFSIGPRLGVNYSNITNPEEAESLAGLVAGLTSTYSINQHSGITLDLLYSGEGYQNVDTKLRLNYMRIPLLYNVFFGELGQSFRSKVFLGPQAGFLLSAESGTTDVKENMKNFAFGIGAGLGFNYQLKDRMWLNTDLRSFFDLTDLRDNPPSSSDKNAIRNIQLSIGIAFGL